MSQSERPKEIRRAPSPRELRGHPAVRNYLLFSLTALFLLVVCLADRGLGWWALVPALIGCLMLLTHGSHGPPLVLASLAGLLGMRWDRHLPGPAYAGWSRFQTPTLMDLVLCVAVLAYVVGHYRLLALLRGIFPPDFRRETSGEWRVAGGEKEAPSLLATRHSPLATRKADLVHAGETAWVGFAVPTCAGLAVLVWTWMMEGGPPLDMPREWWRVLRLVWAGLAVLAAVGTATSYVRMTKATPAESLLYLQDQCWRHTRREQGLLNRWLTWARLRARRKKEAL